MYWAYHIVSSLVWLLAFVGIIVIVGSVVQYIRSEIEYEQWAREQEQKRSKIRRK